MKDFLLLIVGGAILVALFADGGLTVSPTLSPALDAQLSVQYAPDRSVTTIEQQTNIDTNIERQTVIYQAAPAAAAGPSMPEQLGGVNLVDMGPGRCAVQPGDTIESEQGNGACFVANGGQRFFVNPNGNRWPVDDGPGLAPAVATAQPLQPAPAALTLEQLQAAFLRNGGQLPWLWNLRSEASQYEWLSQRGETWR